MKRLAPTEINENRLYYKKRNDNRKMPYTRIPSPPVRPEASTYGDNQADLLVFSFHSSAVATHVTRRRERLAEVGSDQFQSKHQNASERGRKYLASRMLGREGGQPGQTKKRAGKTLSTGQKSNQARGGKMQMFWM